MGHIQPNSVRGAVSASLWSPLRAWLKLFNAMRYHFSDASVGHILFVKYYVAILFPMRHYHQNYILTACNQTLSFFVSTIIWPIKAASETLNVTRTLASSQSFSSHLPPQHNLLGLVHLQGDSWLRILHQRLQPLRCHLLGLASPDNWARSGSAKDREHDGHKLHLRHLHARTGSRTGRPRKKCTTWRRDMQGVVQS
jgi:hypothetical protein